MRAGDAGRRARTRAFSAGALVLWLQFSPDGTQLATAGEGPVQVFPVAGGPGRQLGGTGDANHLVWSAAGDRLAVAADDHTVRLVELSGGRMRIFRGHEARSRASGSCVTAAGWPARRTMERSASGRTISATSRARLTRCARGSRARPRGRRARDAARHAVIPHLR
jgi:WD40 repeat protein